MRDVALVAGDKIIDGNHPASFRQKTIAKVTA